MRRWAVFLAALAFLASAAACSGSAAPGEKTITVLAAASLTEPFGELGQRFTAEHPGVRVEFDFQGSSTLAEQVLQGRQADVFASADDRSMAEVLDAGAVAGQARPFASNRLVVVVPPENPGRVRAFADLARPGLAVVVCAPRVPCGAAANQVERRAGVPIAPASEEDDVKSVLNKVAAGEADAGLVYVSDAVAAGSKVRTVEIPGAGEVVNSYPIAALRTAQGPEAARFVDFVRGPVGQEVLARHGFGAP